MQKEPELTQVEIAKKLGAAQSSVATRIMKLKKNDLIRMCARINFQKLGFLTGVASISTKNEKKVLDFARKCPLFINGVVTIGGRNVFLLFVSENLKTFQNIVDTQIRSLEGVTDVNFAHTVELASPYVGDVVVNPPVSIRPPCGMESFCYNCPADTNYQGSFWRKD